MGRRTVYFGLRRRYRCLPRAQSAPLVFDRSARHLRENSQLTSHQIALAEDHLSRMKVFKQLGFLPASFTQAFRRATLSHLTVLSLHRWASAGGQGSSFAIEFYLSAPALRKMYLDSVLFEINAPLLRILSVTNDVQLYQGQLRSPPTSAILSVLEGTPLLKELRLEGLWAFRPHADNEANTVTQVELPNLKFLRLEDEGNEHDLYRFVHAPSMTEISVDNTGCESLSEFTTTFAVMEHHLRSSAYDVLTVCDEQEDAGTHINIRLCSSTSSRSHYATDANGEPGFRLDAFMYCGSEGVSSLNIMEALLPHINIDAIRFLDLGDIGMEEWQTVEADEVRTMPAPFSNISTVMLNIAPSRRHALALRREDVDEAEGNAGEGEDAEGAGDANNSDVPLPALQHLIVKDLSKEGISLEALQEG